MMMKSVTFSGIEIFIFGEDNKLRVFPPNSYKFKPRDHIVLDDVQECILDNFWFQYNNKNRMGISLQPRMLFDLHSLISPSVNLDSLVAPFTKEEIDKIIKQLPIDKAPGPDGFNGLFMKKCWPLIKEDFCALCQDFFTVISILRASTPPSLLWFQK